MPRPRNSTLRLSKSKKSFRAMPPERCAGGRSRPAGTHSWGNFTRRPRAAWSSRNDPMIASLLVVFREVIEAGLIVGIVLAATKGVPHRGRWVGYGICGGLIGACLVAIFARE